MADDNAGITITVGDEKVKVDFERLTGEDALAYRREVGIGLAQVVSGGLFDVDTLAGMAWLVLRRRNPRLRFRDVARQVTVGSILSDSDDLAENETNGQVDAAEEEGGAEDPTQVTTGGEEPSTT